MKDYSRPALSPNTPTPLPPVISSLCLNRADDRLGELRSRRGISRCVGKMSSRDDELSVTDLITLSAVDLGVTCGNVDKGRALERVTKSDCDL